MCQSFFFFFSFAACGILIIVNKCFIDFTFKLAQQPRNSVDCINIVYVFVWFYFCLIKFIREIRPGSKLCSCSKLVMANKVKITMILETYQKGIARHHVYFYY